MRFATTTLAWLALCLTTTFMHASDTALNSTNNREVAASDRAGSEQTEPIAPCTIRLKHGSYVVGDLIPSNSDSIVELRTKVFSQPMKIEVDAIQSLVFPKRDPLDRENDRTVSVELLDGQSIIGEWTGLDEDTIRLRSSIFGPLELPRKVCRSIRASQQSDEIVYDGPFDNKTWIARSKPEAWAHEANMLATTTPNSSIVGSISIPKTSRVSLAISWTGNANFKIELGTEKVRDDAVLPKPFAAIQVLHGNLILIRESDKQADITVLKKIEKNESRLELDMFLDRRNGKVLVFDQRGTHLGELKVAAEKDGVATGIQLHNFSSSFVLEMMQISKWDGTPPQMATGNQVMTKAGVIEGSLVEFNRVDNTLTIQTADERQTLPVVDFISAMLDPIESTTTSLDAKNDLATDRDDDQAPSGNAKSDSDVTAEASRILENASSDNSGAEPTGATESAEMSEMTESLAQAIDIRFHDGSKLRGGWLSTQNDLLRLQSTLLPEPITFSPAAIYVLSGNTRPTQNNQREGITGKLITEELAIEGHLVSATKAGDSMQLMWEAQGCVEPLPLSANSSGRIQYRTTPRSLPRKADTPVASEPKFDAMQMFLGGRAKGAASLAAPKAPEKKRGLDEFDIEFNNGDTFYGHIESIDESSVHIRSTQTEVTNTNHALMQSAVVNSLPKKVALDSAKIQRMKVVPRNQKNDPPTHLVISTNGDLLRGRLISLNASKLVFEVKLNRVELDRQLVHKIIWLHERNWEQDKKSADNSDNEPQPEFKDPFQVHAVSDNERGLTFQPQQFADGILSGHSDLLGNCSVDLRTVMTLYFGRDIARSIAAAKENPWRLGLAQYPRIYTAEESGDSSSTAHSHLIDAAAPAFGLKNLDGELISIANLQGKVVVLDFWASWCGPCMQTMPVVDRVVGEFPDDVELVAINISEPAERAIAAIKRLGLTVNVLLDVDGEVAVAYGAEAIPETVVIDRKGVVRKVYVGGSGNLESDLKATIQAIIDEK